ncbi:hypothetical protein SLOPH_1720 [Spraguea lophii 42_110]|uniref:Pyrimidine 5-nucleotidase n=1 Tax=Spraguea lophii (strain 42_110) TaxID=1358809 RepID=S7XV79_SPRLO|nr:hypothetical protein SLOPH_1720 [Spraguea lophii 42_110]
MSISRKNEIELFYFEDDYKNCNTEKLNDRYLNDNIDNKRILVFDIDCTLYKKSINLEAKVVENYKNLLKNKYSIKNPQKLIDLFREKYSFRLKGAFDILGLTKEEIIKNVYNINYNEFLKETKELKKFLDSLNYRKVIMTNGMGHHAIAVLKAMGIYDCFESMFSPNFLGHRKIPKKNSENEGDLIFINKPMCESYKLIEDVYGVTDKSNIIFFDDQQVNIDASIRRGWSGYKVDDNKNITEHVKIAINKFWEK